MTKKEAEERVRELEGICFRQRESLASQQEAIVQLSAITDKTIAAITEQYGEGEEEKKLRFSVERFNNVLEDHKIKVESTEDEFVATLSKV